MQSLRSASRLGTAMWTSAAQPRSWLIEERFGPHAQFGPQGSIHTEEACQEAHGLWIPVVFGWMTHVYPNAKSPNDVWAGMDMPMDANTGGEDKK